MMGDAQLAQLFIAYGVTAGAMLLALFVMRAERRAYWRWPVYSVIAMVLAIAAWNALREHALPPSWSITHPGGMYVAALATYALFGVALGLLMAYLTRARPTEFADIPNSPENKPENGREP